MPDLTPKEEALLVFFLRHSGDVLSLLRQAQVDVVLGGHRHDERQAFQLLQRTEGDWG